MKRIEKEMNKTIVERNPETFDERLNNLMEDISRKEPHCERFFDASIGHCAYVKWTETIIEAEDIRDEYTLKGIEYVCGDCPFFVLQKDKRIKYHICNKGERTWYEHQACLALYEMIEKGEIQID